MRSDRLRRLRDKKLDRDRYGTSAELVECLAHESGFLVEEPKQHMEAWRTHKERLLRGASAAFPEALQRALSFRYEAILEENRIRILPREKAIEFWEEWWASESG